MKSFVFLIILVGVLSPAASAQLKLIERIPVPGDVGGHFDHFAVDLTHRRLFATPEGGKALEVFNLDTGKHLETVGGIDEPHAVFYRSDLNRIFVTDGEDGSLRILDGSSYKILKTVKLRADADSAAYDESTRRLYVDNGGKDAKQSFSMISVIVTDTGEIAGELRVESNSLEAIALESRTPRMYVNSRGTNEIAVIDRAKLRIVTMWPITLGKVNVPMALDESNHRLFVGCRDGKMVVLDTSSGKELQGLPITKGADDMVFDPVKKRIYIAADGAVDVYEQRDADHYKLMAKVPTAPVAKTGRLVPEMNRYFVAAPKNDKENAQILVFEVE